MSIFEEYDDEMDAIVDETLGDTIEYSRAGGPFVAINGFIQDEHSSLSLNPIDELDQRKRVKVAIAIIPEPLETDRIRAAKLGPGEFQPTGAFDTTGGRYWISDVQLA